MRGSNAVAGCLIRPKSRLSTFGRGIPSVSMRRTFDVRRIGAHLICFVGVVGALLRLWAAALSSLPACAPSPLPAHNLPRISYATAAHPRTNALTLSPLRLTRDCRRFLSGRAAAREPLSTLLSCGAPPAHFPPAGVRASCGCARPATLSSSRGAPCAYYVSSDIASGHAQSACDTMQNVNGIV